MGKKIEKYNREAVFTLLSQFDTCAKEHGYMEVTEWANGEGFDVEINDRYDEVFHMTWGQFRALKRLVKKLDSR